ncbi:hypothetical protein NFI96_019133 [Prochilodus magdalenae]|nr:hypothetical protein NFI96_019133 [Prochilodus magdalenae]
MHLPPSEKQKLHSDFSLQCSAEMSFISVIAKRLSFCPGYPSVELVVVPRAGKSGLQKLLCTGTGFNPEVKWLPNSGTRTGVSCKARIEARRHIKVSSEIEVPVKQWKEGKEFICQVTDHQGTVQMSTSVCAAHPSAPPQIQLEIPHLPDLLLSPHAEVTASCVVKAAPNSRVSWVLNGNVEKEASTETTEKRPGSNTHWLIVSNLTLSATEWKQHQNVTCRVKRLCDDKHEEKTVNIPAISPPTIRLQEFGQSIICIIEDFYPKDLTVRWKKDEHEVRGLDWKTSESATGSNRAVSVLQANLASSSPGTTYTCEVTHVGKTYSEHLSSKAEFSVKISPPQAKELFLNSKAVIECVISGDNQKEVEGATVSWSVGGRTQTSGITLGGVKQTGSAFTKTSTFTIPESAWFSGDEVICSASSGQKTTSEKIRVRKGATRPSITIYKPDKSVRDSDTVSLVCEVSSSDSADVYIMWKENGGQYMEGNGMTTMVKNDRTQIVLSTLTVTGQKYNSAEFTCAVKDANTQNDIQPRIFPPAKAHSAPTIHLLEVGQSIMCIIEDFYPKALTIKWRQDDREVRGLDWKTTEKESGLYRAVSVYAANLTSSSPGTTYTCEVTHGGKPYSEHLSSKAHFSLKISPPQKKDIFIHSAAVIECVMSGDNRKKVEGATVSWTVGGRTQTSSITHGGVRQSGSSFTKNSTLTITESVWFSGNEVICSASSGLKTTSEKISVRKGATRPSITIYKPDKSVRDSDTVSLVCEVSSSDSADVYIMWQENGGQYMEGSSTTTIKQGRTLITLSYLTVTGQQYNSSIFTCLVKDANLEGDTQPAQITTAKRKDVSCPKCPPCPMSDYC